MVCMHACMHPYGTIVLRFRLPGYLPLVVGFGPFLSIPVSWGFEGICPAAYDASCLMWAHVGMSIMKYTGFYGQEEEEKKEGDHQQPELRSTSCFSLRDA
jgi:hypothetical protein